MRPRTLLRSAIPALVVLSLYAALPATSSASRTAGFNGTELRIVGFINSQRARHGLHRVRPSWEIARAADEHSRAMRARRAIWHGAFASRVRRQVYARRVGEVVGWLRPATRRADPRRIVSMWMHSPGHRAILLDRRMRWVGVGRVTTGRRGLSFITADFTGS
jgi:uncharacterized protein YkwD